MNDFLLKKMGPNGHIVKEKKPDSPYLNNRSQYITKGILFFFTFLSTYSQIWLSPLVDNINPPTSHIWRKAKKTKK